jgi:hypothetical protein
MAQDSAVKIRIDWEADEQKGIYANHLIATFDGAAYTLRFYQVLPPAISGGEDLQAIESVPGRHVATLVMAKDTLPAIVHVLQGMLGRQESEEGSISS